MTRLTQGICQWKIGEFLNVINKFNFLDLKMNEFWERKGIGEWRAFLTVSIM